MKTFFKLLSIAFALSLISNNASSQQLVPATPHPIKYTQPNGKEIQYRLHGDERMFYETTLNGYLIEKAENNYYYYVKYCSMRNKYRLRTKVSTKPAPRFAIKYNNNYIESKKTVNYSKK